MKYVLPLLLSACASAPLAKTEAPLRERLLALAPVAGESFAAFRARGHVDDDDDMATVLSLFAKKRSDAPSILAALVGHKTIDEEGNDPPGRSRAFDAFEAELKTIADKRGLFFTDVEHVAYEIALSDAPREQRVAALVHGDVVPADESGWTTEPFTAVVTAERIRGRGTLDDKGPLAAMIVALDAMKAAGFEAPRVPTLIIGTSEESHWHGIERYMSVRGAPGRGFVADGSFPLGVGEKGISNITLRVKEGPASGIQLRELQGGSVANQVPASASAVLAGDSESLRALQALAPAFITAELGKGTLRVTARGKAAHGAVPDEGENAIQRLAHFLTSNANSDAGCWQLLTAVENLLGGSNDAARIGVTDSHPRFSPATVNVGTVRLADGVCEMKLNLRWPPPRKSAEVVESVRLAFTSLVPSIEVEGGGLDPFLIEDAAFTAPLKEAYRAVYGAEAEEVTLSGTTYTKTLPGSITFGPGLAGNKDERIHAANEYITRRELSDLVEVYTRAMVGLALLP